MRKPHRTKHKRRGIFLKATPLTLPLLIAGGLAVSSAPAADPGSPMALVQQLNQAFIEVAAKASPSVVVITVIAKPGSFSMDDDQDNADDSFNSLPPNLRKFHQQMQQQSEGPVEGQGSGIIIRKDGYILTNQHVVDGAERIEVRLRDGRTFKGKIRGADPASDLAVIKIDASNLPVAEFVDSDNVRVGEFAVAIGAPFSLDYSVTYGHVSAKGRSNIIPADSGGGAMDQDFIQTDANINPGNSGGPLVNIDGKVMGINTLIHGLHSGIGFAIPSNLAREISDKLIVEGKLSRAWLGIEIRAVKDDPDFHELTPGVEDGVIVRSIMTGGPSAKSELKLGDVITTLEGKPISTAQQLRDEIRGRPTDRPLTLEVFRNDRMIKVKVTPALYTDPNVDPLANFVSDTAGSATSSLGMTVHVMTPELARQFNMDMSPGVMVVAVDKNSAADMKDIQPGDIITALNQQPVTTPRQFRDALRKADLKRGVIVNLISGDSSRFEILKTVEE